MTEQRERLIELLKEGNKKAGDHLREATKKVLAEKGSFNSETDYDRRNIYEIEADHLLANGVIVPPCKVGDVVYAYCSDFHVVLPYFIESLNIAYLDEKRLCHTYEANCIQEGELIESIDFDFEDVGKTVFITREKAEKALEGCV